MKSITAAAGMTSEPLERKKMNTTRKKMQEKKKGEC